MWRRLWKFLNVNYILFGTEEVFLKVDKYRWKKYETYYPTPWVLKFLKRFLLFTGSFWNPSFKLTNFPTVNNNECFEKKFLLLRKLTKIFKLKYINIWFLYNRDLRHKELTIIMLNLICFVKITLEIWM